MLESIAQKNTKIDVLHQLQKFKEPGFAILQPTDKSNKRFLNFDMVHHTVNLNDYDITGVYPLVPKLYDAPKVHIYNNIFYTFNEDRPADFHSYSLSVGDIIALKRNNQIQFGFVDSIGFAHLDKETINL